LQSYDQDRCRLILNSLRAFHHGALQRTGFVADPHKATSHVLLRHPLSKRMTTVPIHSKELPRWLLKKIIKDAGLTEDQASFSDTHLCRRKLNSAISAADEPSHDGAHAQFRSGSRRSMTGRIDQGRLGCHSTESGYGEIA
jgi:predicted RNA binding protein YcfA (HicA-like mRNA interferase family)